MYFGVQRPMWDLRVRIAALDAQRRHAHTAFVNAAPPAAQDLSIATDFEAQRAALEAELADSPRPVFGAWDTADSPIYKSLMASVDMLETAAHDWSTWGTDLTGLATAVEAMATASREPPAPRTRAGGPPRSIADASALMTGAEITLQEFAARKKQVGVAVQFLGTLTDLSARVERDEEWLQVLTVADPTPTATNPLCATGLAGLREQLCTAKFDIWEVRSTDDLLARQTVSALTAAEHCIAGYNATAKPTSAAAAATFAPLGISRPSAMGFAASARIAGHRVHRRAPAEQVNFYKRLMNSVDWLLAAVAWAIAMISWLKTSYLGQPFGSVGDYIGVLTWGFGTKVGVEAVIGAFGKIRTLGTQLVIPSVRS